MRLLHKGESLCCFRDSASVTYGCMLPSDLTLSTLRLILSVRSGQSCKQDCETVDFCNSLMIKVGSFHFLPGNLPNKYLGNGQILRTYFLIPPNFHLIPPKNFLFPTEEFANSSVLIGGIPRYLFWKIPRWKFNPYLGRCNQREEVRGGGEGRGEVRGES